MTSYILVTEYIEHYEVIRSQLATQFSFILVTRMKESEYQWRQLLESCHRIPRRKWQNSIKIDFEKVSFENKKWMGLNVIGFYIRKKMAVFLDVLPCSVVDIDCRFRGTYWLRHQGDNPLDWLGTDVERRKTPFVLRNVYLTHVVQLIMNYPDSNIIDSSMLNNQTSATTPCRSICHRQLE